MEPLRDYLAASGEWDFSRYFVCHTGYFAVTYARHTGRIFRCPENLKNVPILSTWQRTKHLLHHTSSVSDQSCRLLIDKPTKLKRFLLSSVEIKIRERLLDSKCHFWTLSLTQCSSARKFCWDFHNGCCRDAMDRSQPTLVFFKCQGLLTSQSAKRVTFYIRVQKKAIKDQEKKKDLQIFLRSQRTRRLSTQKRTLPATSSTRAIRAGRLSFGSSW